MIDALLARMPALPSTAAIADVLRNPKGLFALLAVVALVLYGMSVGRTRALVSLLAIYVAYVLTVLFPFQSWLSARVTAQYQTWAIVALFIVLYAAVFLILSNSVRRGRLTIGEISLWQVAIISVVQIGLLAAICVSFIPQETGQSVLGPLCKWFGSRYALWIWAAASLAILPALRTRRSPY